MIKRFGGTAYFVEVFCEMPAPTLPQWMQK
jgi:hypothetical protein